MTTASAARSSHNAFRRIVVGVDGSSASAAALRWATTHAEELGASVDAVTIYSPAPVLAFAAAGAGTFAATVPTVDPAELAAAELADTVRGVGVADKVSGHVIAAPHAWSGLTDHSRGALMLVVGGHRHRKLDSVLGSTARSCLHHAQCPVLVVPDDGA